MTEGMGDIGFFCVAMSLFVGSMAACGPMTSEKPVDRTRKTDKAANAVPTKLSRIPETHFELRGIIGDYLKAFSDNWLIGIAERNPMILEMFTEESRDAKKDLLPWSGEFAGKYLTGAVQVLRSTGDERLKAYIAGFVEKLVGLQDPDGYLGPWPKGSHLTNKADNSRGGSTWDTWSHYHVMLGLLMWHEDTRDAKALRAAEKIGELLCETFLGQPVKLAGTGSPTMNLAPVHSLCLLYRATGKTAYLDLAKQIADKGFPLAGDYLRTALAGREFYQTPLPRWESLHSIMGLAELYKITGDERYKEAFEHIWWSIVKLDRHNTGGFSSEERAQGNPYHRGPIETCCTIAWTAMSVEMLRLTGDSKVADEMELTLWSATLGSLSKSGKWCTYNTPMEGRRIKSTIDATAFQIRPGSEELNCCSVNAPRGLGLLSDWALTTDGDALVLNWYGPSTLKTRIQDLSVTLTQTTDYPRTGKIRLVVSPEAAREFPLKLRIPQWSENTRVAVNGHKVQRIVPGSYFVLNRTWKPGDRVDIELDMSLHYWVGEREYAGKASIYRGPILLACSHGGSDFSKMFDAPWKRFGESYCCRKIGATVTCEFVGDSIKWVGAKYDDAGKALVEIDGKEAAIVDQYGPVRGQPFVWEHKGLGPGKHVMRLTIIEDKNPKSRDHWINIKTFNDQGCSEASFDARTISPELVDDGGADSIVTLEVTNRNGQKIRLLDFDSAGENGEVYSTWFQVDHVGKCAFSKENPLRSSRLVGAIDLTVNMNLAGRCLLAWLDPAADYAPTGGWNVPHDIGRWWDAVLRLEARTRFTIPGRLEGAMLRNLDRFTDNPDRILLAPEGLDWVKPYFELHSIREGLLAFAALVKYRHNRWARQRGHEMLESLHRRLKPDGTLDVKKFDAFKYVTDPRKALASPEMNGDMTGSTGRAIDGLMFFYEATRDPLALELAGRFAEYHMKHTVNPDGSMRKEIIDKENVGHSHSYMGTLRGLLLYGLETGRRDIIDTVAATYRNGVQEHVITESGWTGHDLGKLRFPNSHGERIAETASAGDAAQLALWLALRAGRTDLLDDVERLVRARLLPAQITSGPPKQLGGWGVHSEPYARGGCILDVAAAVLHGLTDIYDHIVERTDRGVVVNLHLDCDRECARVSRRRDSVGLLTVRLRVRDNLFIRVPGWTHRETVRLTVDGAEARPSFVGSYLRVSKEAIDVNSKVVMRYELPVRETTEKTDVGRVFRFRWRGDDIIGMEPREGPQSLYPALKR